MQPDAGGPSCSAHIGVKLLAARAINAVAHQQTKPTSRYAAIRARMRSSLYGNAGRREAGFAARADFARAGFLCAACGLGRAANFSD